MRHKNQSDFDCVVEACTRLMDDTFAESIDIKDDYVIVEISKKEMIILRQYFRDDSDDGDSPDEPYLEELLTFYAHDVPVKASLSYVNGDIKVFKVGVAD